MEGLGARLEKWQKHLISGWKPSRQFNGGLLLNEIEWRQKRGGGGEVVIRRELDPEGLQKKGGEMN